MRPDDLVRLRYMLDHSIEAIDHTEGRQRHDLDKDRILELALVRLLEIIGEAANRLSAACLSSHPTIPWSQIISLRNRLIHGYDSVDLDILWEILTTDLPQLIADLKTILGESSAA